MPSVDVQFGTSGGAIDRFYVNDSAFLLSNKCWMVFEQHTFPCYIWLPGDGLSMAVRYPCEFHHFDDCYHNRSLHTESCFVIFPLCMNNWLVLSYFDLFDLERPL